MQVQISAVIITFNEEKNIRRCIESLQGIVDEILVVDSFSKDKTKEICLELNARFLEHEFIGHIEQKNWAKDQAKHNYILSLDADEALDETLKQSILEAKEDWTFDAYKMNRLTNYCGKWIHHTAWYPDTKVRLFNRDKGVWGGLNPHDEFVINKGVEIKHLKGDLLHYSFYTKEEHVLQIEKFSTIGAKALFLKGKRANYLLLFIKPLARFIKNYIVRKGFLDGRAGFDISRLSAYANYLKYNKLIKIQRGEEV